MILLAGLVLSGVAQAQIGRVEGEVRTLAFNTLYSSSKTVTVSLEGVPGPYCGTDPNDDFVFIRESDGATVFQSVVSALLAAKVSKTPVEISSHPADGGCVIHKVRFQ